MGIGSVAGESQSVSLLLDARERSHVRVLRSQATLRPGREQLASDLVEIGQCKHRLCPGQILFQPPVADLHEAPELFEDSKRMLADHKWD